MLAKIQSSNDVKEFARQLISEGINFHPDDDFNDYVLIKDEKPCYSKEQAKKRNELIDKCFEVCSNEQVDIYSIMLEVFLIETGMNKYVPLPSQASA